MIALPLEPVLVVINVMTYSTRLLRVDEIIRASQKFRRWSLRGHILKSLIFALILRSLASNLASLRKCFVSARGQHCF